MELMTGLSTQEAERRLDIYGPNEISEHRNGELVRIVRALSSPASLMLIVASLLSYGIGRSFDGSFVLGLLALNVGMTLWHGHKTDRALAELQAQLRVRAKVFRDGVWQSLPSPKLVPGDVIECTVGALVPADARIDTAVNLEINEAVLTGESFPKSKKVGETAYSGSVVATGTFTGTVTDTGNHAFFGTIATSATGRRRASRMERDILAISRFLVAISVLAALVLTIVFLAGGYAISDVALLVLSLFIAGIPVSLPTVMTLILSIGALALAQKKALVRRLESLEDLANVTVLLTDKTGTLTENSISVERVHAYRPFTEMQAIVFAAAAAAADPESAIDRAIVKFGSGRQGPYQILASIPADSERKRSTTLLMHGAERILVSLGAPPIVEALCAPLHDIAHRMRIHTEEAARSGSRAIAVAIKRTPIDIDDERGMELVGMFILADPLRADVPETIEFLRREGVRVMMVTGDTKETATHIVEALNLQGTVRTSQDVSIARLSTRDLEATAAFAEVLPEDKLALVKRVQLFATVGATGDGVNDLPALRRADVGIAVVNAVDALKGTADVVLLASGISVMQTALTEARKVFFRLYNYSIYRISESFRLILTALVLGLIIKGFPLTPIELILLAFLNDIPIITLAFDRVKRLDRPADLAPRERFVLGSLFGLVGVANSILFYFFASGFLHLSLPLIQTAFFLKLTVSGHMLIYVAHTKERWWRFLPATSVITATTMTQLVATTLAVGGVFVAAIPFSLAFFVWLWAFLFMQVTELMKIAQDAVVRLTSRSIRV